MKLNWYKLVAIISICLISPSPALAKKPDSPGNSGKHHYKAERDHRHKSHHRKKEKGKSRHAYFNEERTSRIRQYYSKPRKSGACPPGLAKKNNHCQPPGQVKKWRRGQPLPRDVIYYNVPRRLVYELGPIPEGQKIVRVGTDLLLITIGTGMVIDAFEDLRRIW